MAAKNHNESKMNLICMESETLSHQGELVWSIKKNFVSQLERGITSLEFSLVPCCKIRLQLCLLLQKLNENTTNATVYIDRKDKGVNSFQAEIQCSIQNPKGDNFQIPINANVDHTDHTLYGNSDHSYEPLQLSSLLPWDVAKYSSDDALILRCQMKLKNCCDVAQFVNTEKYKTNLDVQLPSDMISSLHRLNTEKQFADCKIKVGGITLPAHKGILSVRSPVFQKYFEQDMIEKRTSEIEIPDFEPKIVSALLTYIYTNTVEDLTIEEFRLLFAIADKYDVGSLMDRCTTLLLRNLNEETVFKTLKLADMHNNDILIKKAARFIYENLSALRNKPEFLRFKEKYPHLILDILLDEVIPGPDIHFEPVIPLPDLIEVETGEEDETIETPLLIFRAKLFRSVPNTKQWKERGIGDIKILSHNEKMRFRIILRRDQVPKVACNHCITEEMPLTSLSASENALCWTAIDFSDGVGKATQFAVRFKHKEQTQQFKEVFLNCQERLRNCKQSAVEEKVAAIAQNAEPVGAYGGASAAEDDDEGEESEELIFEKRVTLEVFDDAADKFKVEGMGDLKIAYDNSYFGYRVVFMEAHYGRLLFEHLITVQTCLRTDGKTAIWAAIDHCMEPVTRRQFRVTFSSMEALNEFSKHFEEGKEIGIKSLIAEKSD